MATEASFARFIQDQLEDLGDVVIKKMFGEYGVFLEGKMVALLADNVFYLKPTSEVEVLLKEIMKAPPYNGAKDYFVIEQIEDKEYLCDLVRTNANVLPLPKPKKPKSKT